MNIDLSVPVSDQVKAIIVSNLGPYWSEKLADTLDISHACIVLDFKQKRINTLFAVTLENKFPELFNAEEILGAQVSQEIQIMRKALGFTATPTESESFYTEHQTYSFTVPNITGTFTISNILAGDDGEGNEFVNFDLTLQAKTDELESRDVYSMACAYYTEEGRPAIKPVKNNTFDYFFEAGTSEKVFNVILKNGFPG